MSCSPWSKRRKNNNNWLLVVGVLLLVLFGTGIVQMPTLAIGGSPPANTTTTTTGGSGPSGGSAPTPATNTSGNDSGAFSFWNFCGMFPEICFPTPPADQPAAPQPDMTADPCDLNPNMIGCSPTTPTQPAVRQIYFGRCSGVSWGLPTEVLHSATGDRYTSFECTTNQECEDNPPGAYPGRPSALVCCNGECFDTP